MAANWLHKETYIHGEAHSSQDKLDVLDQPSNSCPPQQTRLNTPSCKELSHSAVSTSQIMRGKENISGTDALTLPNRLRNFGPRTASRAGLLSKTVQKPPQLLSHVPVKQDLQGGLEGSCSHVNRAASAGDIEAKNQLTSKHQRPGSIIHSPLISIIEGKAIRTSLFLREMRQLYCRGAFPPRQTGHQYRHAVSLTITTCSAITS